MEGVWGGNLGKHMHDGENESGEVTMLRACAPDDDLGALTD